MKNEELEEGIQPLLSLLSKLNAEVSEVRERVERIENITLGEIHHLLKGLNSRVELLENGVETAEVIEDGTVEVTEVETVDDDIGQSLPSLEVRVVKMLDRQEFVQKFPSIQKQFACRLARLGRPLGDCDKALETIEIALTGNEDFRPFILCEVTHDKLKILSQMDRIDHVLGSAGVLANCEDGYELIAALMVNSGFPWSMLCSDSYQQNYSFAAKSKFFRHVEGLSKLNEQLIASWARRLVSHLNLVWRDKFTGASLKGRNTADVYRLRLSRE